jgi:hypothetical protein
VPDPPRTEAELTARIASYRSELAGTAQAREAARFLLLTPPLPAIARRSIIIATIEDGLRLSCARWPRVKWRG